MLLLVDILKLLAEIAWMALLGQWVLGLLAGQKRETNMVWQLFDVLTRPLVRTVRHLTPRVVIDRHVPLVAFLLLTFLWVIVTITKIDMCVRMGVHLCK
ncbi:MAG: hypothetical protein EOO21_02540 [Comamonadaceae bacterium]|nr:MAG: hypothetical protein EOO21_02540 [Comamonadaceae bacterium]